MIMDSLFSKASYFNARQEDRPAPKAHARTLATFISFFSHLHNVLHNPYTTDTDQAFYLSVLIGSAAFDWIRPPSCSNFLHSFSFLLQSQRKSFLFCSLPTCPAGYVRRSSFVHPLALSYPFVD